jgi:hypothetical protein
MPNTRIRDQWEPLVKQIIADLGPRAGPTPILRELKDRVEQLRRGGSKSLLTIPAPDNTAHKGRIDARRAARVFPLSLT